MNGRVLIVAFDGWTDAGEASTRAATELRDRAGLRLARSIDPEPYYDYQFSRPRISIRGDGTREIVWPGAQLYTPADDGRLLVLLAQEPARSWQAFVAEILDIALAHDVEHMILLGSLLADAPHTRETPITLSSDNEEVRDRLQLERSQYEGPVGLSSVLADSAETAGIPTLMMWAQVPHYVHSTPNPKAALALVRKVASLVGVAVEPEALAREAEQWQQGVDTIADDDEEMAEYIQQLEHTRDTVESPEASGEAIAEEFERYLRRDDDRGKGDRGEGPLGS
ncbi:PAC2 family protein [Mycetocola reblochoni]|uniref:AC2 (Proteasome assembly chaperone) family n=1 Tax=Mycetocola reblochoni REB411 TaxID=1255698 RepID=A0A1R4J653_9MICO|nr:PAC2 family protein [Mycetocola reblochoni]SJN27414.1 hypothetical protein FM119_05615 [Mycetocola reblochoni REB411]